MAKRKRDYKAEYARRKRTAQKAGYASEREYKRARKAVNTPRNASPISKPILIRQSPSAPLTIKQIRAANAKWSRQHSKRGTSHWNASASDSQARRYYDAFIGHENVIGPGANKAFNKSLRDYLVPEIMDSDEFENTYTL